MKSTEIVNQAALLLNQPQHERGLKVIELLELLQDEDPTVTRGQILNLMTKTKWGKVKEIAVAMSDDGKQIFVKSSAYHRFMVDYNASFELLSKEAALIENQLTEDQRTVVDEALEAMRSLYSRRYVDEG